MMMPYLREYARFGVNRTVIEQQISLTNESGLFYFLRTRTKPPFIRRQFFDRIALPASFSTRRGRNGRRITYFNKIILSLVNRILAVMEQSRTLSGPCRRAPNMIVRKWRIESSIRRAVRLV